jgi:hypothetical protein
MVAALMETTKMSEKVACQVVAVEPDLPTKSGYGYYSGYVTVKLLEGDHEGDLVNMMNGSVQNVPLEERVIGRVGTLRWDTYGAYGGWLWSKYEEDEDEDYEYDGQPDEAQEWYDFDPDC